MLEVSELDYPVDREQYKKQLGKLQKKLRKLGRKVYRIERPVVIVLEGPDGAGKGGAIRSLTRKLDPRGYTVYAINRPAGGAARRHLLWRFWSRIPKAGRIAIFDRSWYRQVVFERINGFRDEEDCKRSYREINQFERQLTDFGTILVKFWIQISPDEQRKRLELDAGPVRSHWHENEQPQEWSEKREQFYQAANEMLYHTDTTAAPWTIVPGDSKRDARIQLLKVLVETLDRELNDETAPTAEQKMDKKGKRKKKK